MPTDQRPYRLRCPECGVKHVGLKVAMPADRDYWPDLTRVIELGCGHTVPLLLAIYHDALSPDPDGVRVRFIERATPHAE